MSAGVIILLFYSVENRSMERDACSSSVGNLPSSGEAESREGELGCGREAGEHASTAHVPAAVIAERAETARDATDADRLSQSQCYARSTFRSINRQFSRFAF